MLRSQISVWGFVLGLGLACVAYACSTDKAKPGAEGDGGAPSAGASDGEIIDAGGPGETGGAATGGLANRAGAAGESAAEAGSTAAGGDSNEGGGTGAPSGALPALPGPTQVDQAPIVINKSHELGNLVDVVAAGLDASGNATILSANSTLRKYSPAGAELWTNTSLPPTQTIAFDANGEAFLGGIVTYKLPGETLSNNAQDAWVGKVDAQGKLAWAHQWGPATHTAAIAIGPNGSVVAIGSSTGQVPGNPPTNAGGHFAARYEADGARTFLKQYPGGNVGLQSLLLSSAGDLYFGLSSTSIRHIASDGTLVGDSVISIAPEAAPAWGHVAFAPGEEAVHDFVQIFNGPSPAGLITGVWSLLGLDGKALWYRPTAKKTAVIDAVEGVTWTGTFSQFSTFVVTTDAVFLAGKYNNSYTNGANPKPPTSPLFVGRYTLEGEQVWFTEFLTEDPSIAWEAKAIGTSQSGDVSVIASAAGSRTYRFQVSATNGSLL